MRDVFSGPVTTSPQTAREAAWDALWVKRDEEALDLYAEYEAAQLRVIRMREARASMVAIGVACRKRDQLSIAWRVARERASRVLDG